MKKGFTLVELLGAIILLGLISLIIAVPIIARINNASGKISRATERILKEHVMQYISENSNDFRSTKPGTKYYITLDELEFNRDGFEVKVNNKNLDPSTQVLIEINENGDYDISVLNDSEELPSIKSLDIGTNVIFNGFSWKVIGKDDNTKTVRLLSNEIVGAIPYNLSDAYKDSSIYKWLNKEFAAKLNYINIIKETENGLINIPTEEENTNYSIANCKYAYLYNEEIKANGDGSNSTLYVRPAINVYEGTAVTTFEEGSTTKYVLREFKNDQSNLMLKEADLSVGEYISFDNKLYRIIEYGKDLVKVISTFSDGTSIYASSNDKGFNLNDGAGYTLNQNNVSNYMIMNNIYIGGFFDKKNYEIALKKTKVVYGVYKALPKFGEIMTLPINVSSSFWILTQYENGAGVGIVGCAKRECWYTNDTGFTNDLVYTTYISASNVITSGNGTKNNPYVLQ